MSDEEITRPETPRALPPWADDLRREIVDEIRDFANKSIVSLGHKIQSFLADMIVAAETRITQHHSDRFDQLVKLLGEQSETIRYQAELTRTHSAELAGRIQGAVNAAERAANHVIAQSGDVGKLKRDVEGIRAELVLMKEHGVKMRTNGNGAER